MANTQAIIALGANLGEAAAALLSAARRLGCVDGVRVLKLSHILKTAPVNCPKGSPDFFNAAALIETKFSAQALLEVLLNIETEMGRARGVTRNEPREIDLDLIFYGDAVLREDGLTLPHPRMHERRFVLEPVAEIAPDWVHPTLKRTVVELFAALVKA